MDWGERTEIMGEEGTLEDSYSWGSIYTFPEYTEELRRQRERWPNVGTLYDRDHQLKQLGITNKGKDVLFPMFNVHEIKNRSVDAGTWNKIEKIGKGIEGDVYRTLIGETECAIKIFNQKVIDDIRKNHPFGRNVEKPMFLERLGFTGQLTELLQSMPQNHIKIHAIQEYAATAAMHITRMGPRMTYEPLSRPISYKGYTKPDVDQHLEEQGKAFMAQNHITESKLEAIQHELYILDTLCVLAEAAKIPPLEKGATRVDFSPGNFLVEGFDPSTQILKLCIIDQGGSSLQSTSADGNHISIENQRLESLYKWASNIPEAHKWLKKHRILKAPEVTG